ncbi:unnamed protein product [Calypogeia fissa]
MKLCQPNGLCNWQQLSAAGIGNGGGLAVVDWTVGQQHTGVGPKSRTEFRGTRGATRSRFSHLSDGMCTRESLALAPKVWQGWWCHDVKYNRRQNNILPGGRGRGTTRELSRCGSCHCVVGAALEQQPFVNMLVEQQLLQQSRMTLLNRRQNLNMSNNMYRRSIRTISSRRFTTLVLDNLHMLHSSSSSFTAAGACQSCSPISCAGSLVGKRDLGRTPFLISSTNLIGKKQQQEQRRRRGLYGVGVDCRAVAVIGEAIVAAAASTRPSHAAALATVTQLAVTAAAVVYGAFMSPYAHSLIGRNDKNLPVRLEFDGVDVTGYKIFEEPEVQKAIAYAREAHMGQMRKTGEPYITHCIHTARILAALVPSKGKRAVQTVVAGILHDVVDDTVQDLRDVREKFGRDVARLVGAVSKLSNINQLLRRHRRISADQNATETGGLSPAEVDSLRVMLLGMVNDPRVVLIKLADRLHNMRTIYALPPAKASAVAQETLAVWCSLASRLGVWTVKAELEDLCFAVLQPKTFRHLRAALAAIWSPDKDWRYLRRITKRAKRRALLYGDLTEKEPERKPDPEDEEELSMKDLLESVVPFDILLDRNRRHSGFTCPLTNKDGAKKKIKVVRDAEVALAALGACEEALDKELLISTSYVPGMEVTLSSRLKSLYSTHCKMRRKGVSLDEVYDARALRVVVGDGGGKLHVAAVEGCYSLLNVIHRLWTPVGGEFDDYIVNPKRSGYQSLHTAVMGPDGAPIEVQIRTQGMHEYAEYGHAAHWLYKEGDNTMRSMEAFTETLLSPPADSESSHVEDHEIDEEEFSRYGREYKPSRTVERVPPRAAQIGHPALRIEDGRLLAAVIVRVEDEGRELLVAVSFSLRAREAVAAGRARNQRKRWEAYAQLYKKVSDQWWFAPGHGDWSTCLERYTLCSDGMYHKQDQFQRALPTFIQLLDLNEQEQEDYKEVMEMVQEGREVSVDEDFDVPEENERPLMNQLQSGVSTTRMNNKVRLLRSMLLWEQEFRHEAALDGSVTVLNPEHPNSAALTEVLVIRWPDGEIMRMPAGSTAADAARRLGMGGNMVYVNSQLALPHMNLKDGDLVEIRP